MDRIKGILFWTILTIGIIWVQRFEVSLKYLFFLRVPLLMGLFIVALPLICVRIVPAMLKNLFVLRTKWQLALAIAAVVMNGMAITLVYNSVLVNAPYRFDLPEWHQLPQSKLFFVLVAIALALPTIITATLLSRDKLNPQEHIQGVALGGLLTTFLLIFVALVTAFLESATWLKQVLLGIIYLFPENAQRGYINSSNGEIATEHFLGMGFLVAVLIAYIYGFFNLGPNLQLGKPNLQPSLKPNQFEAPALFYLLLITLIIILFFGGTAFFLDYFRIPVLASFLIISALVYWRFNVDHFYQLNPEAGIKPQIDDFQQALTQRLKLQSGQEKTIVVVCASGGGIQAAGWTAKVLTGLQAELDNEFAKAICLISSASGGSVGTMYYLDRFGNYSYPDTNKFDQIFASATKGGIDATGWGLAYPDLWRFIGLPFLAPKMLDRGTAIEVAWKAKLENPNTSLATWRERILQGKIPIPVFNATLVEDGSRFLISPMTFGKSAAQKYIDFNTVYPECDIDATTAARLSATFPYVSPVCRGNIPSGCRDRTQAAQLYHVADGGFFDNSGVFTALEWLDNVVLPPENLQITRVFLIEINAFANSVSPEPTSVPKNNSSIPKGWLFSLAGPLIALLNVRSSTQTARNIVDIGDFKAIWGNKLKIEHFSFYFPGELDGFPKYEPPLSWKLTEEEKKKISEAWDFIATQPAGVLQDLKNAWKL